MGEVRRWRGGGFGVGGIGDAIGGCDDDGRKVDGGLGV